MKRRNTPSKEAILDLLISAGKAMSRDAIEQKIDIEIDRATIYRVLNRFCEDGLVHKIVADDGKQYFAVCMKCDEKKLADNHFHFRCTSCQTIEWLQCRKCELCPYRNLSAVFVNPFFVCRTFDVCTVALPLPPTFCVYEK